MELTDSQVLDWNGIWNIFFDMVVPGNSLYNIDHSFPSVSVIFNAGYHLNVSILVLT